MFKKFIIISIAFSFSQILFCQQGWYQLTSGTGNNLRSVYFTDVNTGYAVGYGGTILKTTNGGLNWTSQPLGISENLNAVHFIGQTGYAVGGAKSEKSNVKIIICDVLGREVSILVNENLRAGKYEVEWDASDFPSGVYFYTISTNEFREAKKMALLK